jgi:membrane fusion protein (multidrug efflux system)
MGKMVFTVSPDNKLAPRPVELDGWSNGEWIVTKGLQNGDRVLVDGFIKAHTPGMTVTPVPLPAKSDKAPEGALAAPVAPNNKPAAAVASTKAAQ